VGSATPALVVGGQWNVHGIVSDEDFVYWTNKCSKSVPCPGSVMKAKIGGSDATVLVPVSADTEDSTALLLRGNDLVWTSERSGNILSVPKTGGDRVVVAKGQSHPTAIVVAGDRLVWANLGSGGVRADGTIVALPPTALPVELVGQQPGPSGLAVRGTTLYWINRFGPVMKSALDGTGATALTTKQPFGLGLIAGPDRLYWTTLGGFAGATGTVHSLVYDGAEESIVAANQPGPVALAAVNSQVFWTNVGFNADGSIARSTTATPAPQTFAGAQSGSIAQSGPAAIFATANFVYWGTTGRGDGRIMRASIP